MYWNILKLCVCIWHLNFPGAVSKIKMLKTLVTGRLMEKFIGRDTESVSAIFQHIHLWNWEICHTVGPSFVSFVAEVCCLELEPLCDTNFWTRSSQMMKRGLRTLPQKPSSSQCIHIPVDLPVRHNSSRLCRHLK